ncbi:MAG: YopX family protein [Liquorilactobacillus mali]|uniref:YopX family protein n=1 Tax=Liquorilactobacillus mali TaxID=1618 RepID=UPI0039EBDDD6
MREYKFRAWSKKLNDYVKPAHFMIDGCGQVFRSEWLDSDTKTKDLIIEQWTGLKDKNGKDIYEGDIIKYYGSNKRVKVKTTYGIVFYDSEHGCFNSRIQNGEHNKGGINPGDDLVVGNIHENADLLEVSE